MAPFYPAANNLLREWRDSVVGEGAIQREADFARGIDERAVEVDEDGGDVLFGRHAPMILSTASSRARSVWRPRRAIAWVA